MAYLKSRRNLVHDNACRAGGSREENVINRDDIARAKIEQRLVEILDLNDPRNGRDEQEDINEWLVELALAIDCQLDEGR